MISDQISEEMVRKGANITKKGFSFAFKLTKLTGRNVKKAFVKYGPKICDRIDKGINGNEKTLRELSAEGKELENIDVSNMDFGKLSHILRKYDIDFAVKVDRNAQPPTYYCFFKANNAEQMKQAVREYANMEKRDRARRNVTMMYPSFRDKIRDFVEKARGMNRNRERVFTRHVNHGAR